MGTSIQITYWVLNSFKARQKFPAATNRAGQALKPVCWLYIQALTYICSYTKLLQIIGHVSSCLFALITGSDNEEEKGGEEGKEEEEESETAAKRRKPWGDTAHFCPVALKEQGVLWPGSEDYALRYCISRGGIINYNMYTDCSTILMLLEQSQCYQMSRPYPDFC